MFRLPSIVRLPRHKRFAYKPRFYDEEKAQRRARAEKRTRLSFRRPLGEARGVLVPGRVLLWRLCFILLFVGLFLSYVYWGDVGMYVWLAVLGGGGGLWYGVRRWRRASRRKDA